MSLELCNQRKVGSAEPVVPRVRMSPTEVSEIKNLHEKIGVDVKLRSGLMPAGHAFVIGDVKAGIKGLTAYANDIDDKTISAYRTGTITLDEANKIRQQAIEAITQVSSKASGGDVQTILKKQIENLSNITTSDDKLKNRFDNAFEKYKDKKGSWADDFIKEVGMKDQLEATYFLGLAGKELGNQSLDVIQRKNLLKAARKMYDEVTYDIDMDKASCPRNEEKKRWSRLEKNLEQAKEALPDEYLASARSMATTRADEYISRSRPQGAKVPESKMKHFRDVETVNSCLPYFAPWQILEVSHIKDMEGRVKDAISVLSDKQNKPRILLNLLQIKITVFYF